MSFLPALPAALSGITMSQVATGLAIGGTAIGALGQIQSGQAQAAAYEQNAQAALMQAKTEGEAAKQETYKLSQERRQMIGEQATLFGGSGITLEGSPLDVMSQTAAAYERDIQLAGYNANLKQRALQYEARAAKSSARSARMSGWIGAGGTILSGIGQSLLIRGAGSGGTGKTK